MALFADSSDDDSKSDEVKPEKSIMPSSSQKGKQTVTMSKETKKPSQHTVATWRRGGDDDDMEPSAKMLSLIEQLRAAEHAGDKTIVYSQCPSPLHNIFCLQLLTMMRARNRDVDAGLGGVAVHTIRDPEFAIRWEDAERCARSRARRVPQDRRAQSHLDQYQMRRRRVKPHLRQPSRQVSTPHTRISPFFSILSSRGDCTDAVFFFFLSMDLSWNYAAESQAYDRVHRLGQEKDVFVKRLVVENTIEERMLRLQDVKKGACIMTLSSHSLCFKKCVRLSRIGRCSSRRRYRCQTKQAKC